MEILEYINDENWDGLMYELLHADANRIETIFSEYNHYLPDDVKQVIAINCYALCDGGNNIPIIREIIKGLPHQHGDYELPAEYLCHKEITIYRGGRDSIQEAPYSLSWTLDIEVAKHFFHRIANSQAGTSHLYKGTIKADDIIAYLGDDVREESEVLQCGKVYNVVELERFDFD